MSHQHLNIDPKIKKALSKKYAIERVIGTGGMAIVYQAVQKTLDRKVALKVVHQNFVHDAEFIHRFTKEARVVASLNHPNIITIHDVDSVDQFHYMTMEYLSGEPLSEKIRKNGKLGINEALKIVIPIAKALNYLHNNGFIHRDVKSSNIFVCEDGRPVLMDFGIVYTSESMLSQPGTVLGTPEFMSPEQANGEDLTGSSDLYSLGVILYECLTATMPFRTDNPLTTVYKVINEAPRPISELNPKVPDWLNSQILNLLSKDPRDRVASANLFIKNILERKTVKYDFKGIPVFKPVKEVGKKEDFYTQKINSPGSNQDVTQINFSTERPADFNIRKLWITGALAIACISTVFFLTFFNPQGFGNDPQGKKNEILTSTTENQLPIYPGGYDALNTYFNSRVSVLNQSVAPGSVYLKLVIGINGEVINSEVLKSVNQTQGAIALQIAKDITGFLPAQKDGKPFEQEMIIRIEFS